MGAVGLAGYPDGQPDAVSMENKGPIILCAVAFSRPRHSAGLSQRSEYVE
jgi:hypothetical protein